jgi:hypothetical protein
VPQTTSNFLKIVENHFCDENNYFGAIKTCFETLGLNAPLPQVTLDLLHDSAH